MTEPVQGLGAWREGSSYAPACVGRGCLGAGGSEPPKDLVSLWAELRG